LNNRFVNNRQHFFGHGFSLGKKSRAKSGGGDNCFSNLTHKLDCNAFGLFLSTAPGQKRSDLCIFTGELLSDKMLTNPQKLLCL
jgi:hypothetical protein